MLQQGLQVLSWNLRHAPLDVCQDLALHLSTQTSVIAALVQEGPAVDEDIDYDMCMGARLCLASSELTNRGAVGILLLDRALPWLHLVKRCPSGVVAVLSDGQHAILLISAYLPSTRFPLTSISAVACTVVWDNTCSSMCHASSSHWHCDWGRRQCGML